MSFSRSALSILSVAAVAGLCMGLPAAQAAESLTKAQVEKMMHDYIMDNPKLIMDSVDAYQQKQQQERETKANANVKQNKDSLIKDTESPVAGNPDGDVTVIEFFDYNCHYCKGAFPGLQTLLGKDKKVRVIFKEFPILGPSSITASKWALAANKQKKYFEFHTAMMLNKEPIGDDMLEKVAKGIGMDIKKAKADMELPEVQTEIEKVRSLAGELDISGTPAFIIGDDISRGAIPESVMEQKVSAARAATPSKD